MSMKNNDILSRHMRWDASEVILSVLEDHLAHVVDASQTRHGELGGVC
jgi:hypothetical protein